MLKCVLHKGEVSWLGKLTPFSGADVAAFDLTVLWMDIGVALLAGVFLGLEFYASQVLARRAPGVLALLLAAVGGVLWWLSDGARVAAGCGIVAAFFLLAWLISFESVRQQLSRRLTPKAVWCLVLVVGMIASRYQASHVAASVHRTPAEESVEFRDVPVRETKAVTDAGLDIPLFQFEMFTPAEEAEQAILAEERYQHQVIRLAEPSSNCNCHGWVFTGGQFGIRNPDVPAILQDNGYAPVQDIQEGDLAIYTAGREFTHSGIVRVVDPGGRVLIESKWGPFGVFLHAPDMQPFSGTYKIYRSARKGHVIKLQTLLDSQ